MFNVSPQVRNLISCLAFLSSAPLVLAALNGCGSAEIDRNKFEAAKSDDGDNSKPVGKSDGKTRDESPGTAVSSGVDANDSNPRTRTSISGSNSQNIKDNSSKAKQAAPTGKSPDQSQAETGQTNQPAPETNRWVVPTSGINDILVFMDELDRNVQVLSRDPVKNRIPLIQVHRARVKAAEKVMDRPELLLRAARSKLDALILMGQLGEPRMEDLALEYSESVTKFENQDIADFGRLYIISTKFRRAIESKEKSDVEKFMTNLEDLIRERRDSTTVFGSVNQVVMSFFRAGMREDGLKAMRILVNAYKNTKSNQISATLPKLREQLFLWENNFDTAIMNMRQSQDEASVDEFIEVVKTILNRPKLTRETFGEVFGHSLIVENLRMYAKAKELYRITNDAYEKQEDAKLAVDAAKICEKSIRRIELLGKELVVEGIPLGSLEPLDWSLFRGKVVILTFWQSEAHGCAAELQRLAEFVKANDDKDIELIGANIDKDPQKTVARLRGRAPSWTVLFTPDLKLTGFESPMATRCGVANVPYTILIGPDGKVVELAVMSSTIEQRVADLLNTEVQGQNGMVKPASAVKEEEKPEQTEANGAQSKGSKTQEKEAEKKEPAKSE